MGGDLLVRGWAESPRQRQKLLFPPVPQKSETLLSCLLNKFPQRHAIFKFLTKNIFRKSLESKVGTSLAKQKVENAEPTDA